MAPAAVPPVCSAATDVAAADTLSRAAMPSASVGDALVAPLGLTSARWQVLGAIGLSDLPLSAPRIAAAMGISRQGAQKQIHRLVKEGLLNPFANPAHKRSPRYGLTEHGVQLVVELETTQADWVNELAAAIPAQDLEIARCVLERLTERLMLSAERRLDL